MSKEQVQNLINKTIEQVDPEMIAAIQKKEALSADKVNWMIEEAFKQKGEILTPEEVMAMIETAIQHLDLEKKLNELKPKTPQF